MQSFYYLYYHFAGNLERKLLLTLFKNVLIFFLFCIKNITESFRKPVLDLVDRGILDLSICLYSVGVESSSLSCAHVNPLFESESKASFVL